MNIKEGRLVRQQLDRLQKAEMKFLRYQPEGMKFSGGDFVRKKVPKKLMDTLEAAFEKGFGYIFDKGTGLIERSGNLDAAKENAAYHYTLLRQGISKESLRNFDVSASNKTWTNKGISSIEGAALGVFGIGLPDIPVFLGMIFKSIYEIAASYGFDYKSQAERAFILSIIRIAASEGSERILASRECDRIGELIDGGCESDVICNSEEITSTSTKLASSMLVAKFIQGFTLVGTVGGVFNYLWIHRISTIARIKYKKRFLLRLAK